MENAVKKGYFYCLLYFAVLGSAFMLPWLHSEKGTVDGIGVVRLAYNSFDYFTVCCTLLIILSFGVGWYLMLVQHNKIMTFVLSIIGMMASLSVVDHSAQEMIRETHQLVSRGIGNYLLLLLFGAMLASVVYKPMMKMLESSSMIHLM